MRCTWRLKLLSGFLLLLPVVGCQSSHPVANAKYQTVGIDPHRNTELAKQLNLQALDVLQKNEYSVAEQLLKHALAADIMYAPAHNNLGKVYFHENKFYLAAWEFQYASKLLPDQPEPRNNLGLVFEEAGKLDDAITAYSAAMQLAPDNPDVVGNLARARVRRGDSGSEVQSLLNKLILLDPKDQWADWARRQLHNPTTRS